jgi:hypothetical protein
MGFLWISQQTVTVPRNGICFNLKGWQAGTVSLILLSLLVLAAGMWLSWRVCGGLGRRIRRGSKLGGKINILNKKFIILFI